MNSIWKSCQGAAYSNRKSSNRQHLEESDTRRSELQIDVKRSAGGGLVDVAASDDRQALDGRRRRLGACRLGHSSDSRNVATLGVLLGQSPNACSSGGDLGQMESESSGEP